MNRPAPSTEELLPLIELLARVAYESMVAAERGSLPESNPPPPELPSERSAA